jgi:uncharacterized protein YbbC (DUF1343 family)
MACEKIPTLNLSVGPFLQSTRGSKVFDMRLGIDVLLNDEKLLNELRSKKVALLAHPASVTYALEHSLDALQKKKVNLVCAFGPQHGMRGEKQDNMIESDDYLDPLAKIPVFSLYGTVRRPTREMMSHFDVMLVDLQDVGCRIYTYLTTLFYILEEAQRFGKEVIVLDRPNPAGRPVEGTLLKKGWESFVGMGPVPMRHGLTLGEIGQWMVDLYKMKVSYRVVKMQGYSMIESPGFGWPVNELSWVSPSPNMPTLCTARVYAGTVLLEGTNLSEGRGTTRPLQIFGAPKIQSEMIIKKMYELAPEWLKGCAVRPCYFEPTFHKFKGELCAGMQIHVDFGTYNHGEFKPYRLMNLFFKALRVHQPEILAWRQPPYEYEQERLPIDLLNGGPEVRQWVDDGSARPGDLEKLLAQEEKHWEESTRQYHLYK